MSKERRYEGVTPEKRDEMKATLRSDGAKVSEGTEGEIELRTSGMKFKFNFFWDGENMLTLKCTKKTWVVRLGKLWTKLDEKMLSLGIKAVV